MTNEDRAVLIRPAPPADLIIRYGDGPDHLIDLRLPPGPPTRPAPLLLLLHGGFWRAEFDRIHLGHAAAALAAHGYAAASIEYHRPAPGDTGWPATLLDVAAALDRAPDLVAAAASGRVDPTRVCYAGHSAGGHLALWGALRHRLPPGAPGRRRHPPAIAGVLGLAPVCDLAAAHRHGLGDHAVQEFLGGPPSELPDRYAATDPARLPTPDAPLTLLHGRDDIRVPLAQTRRYAAATGAHLIELPGTDHFAPIDPLSSIWPTVPAALDALLNGAASTDPPTRAAG